MNASKTPEGRKSQMRDISHHISKAMQLIASQIDPENLCEAEKYARALCSMREAVGNLIITTAARAESTNFHQTPATPANKNGKSKRHIVFA